MWISFSRDPRSMGTPPNDRNRWLHIGASSANMQPMVAYRRSGRNLMTPVSTRPGRTLAVASIAAFMTSLDTMVVTTALPTLRADLGGSVGTLEWTMNAYYLAFACLLITAAGLGDRFGRRRV